MNKFKKVMLAALPALVLLTGACSDDDYEPLPLPTDLQASAENVLFLKTAGTEKLYIQSPSTPTVTTDGADWLTVSTPAYNGDSRRVYAMDLTVSENSTVDTRTSVLTVSAGGKSVQVNVIQASSDAIAFASSTMDVAEAGGPLEVLVKATGEYTIEAPYWATVEQSRAYTESTIRLTVGPNNTGAERRGDLLLTLKDVPDVSTALTLVQAGTLTPITRTAKQIAADMYAGWNIGNTLEATGGETAWGNPKVNQRLIHGLKEAGFNAVRIPCSWNQYLVADEMPYTISPEWMARVHEVVDYIVSEDMYAILNIHWDGGWLEQSANAASQDAVNIKQNALWTQIANEFRTYGDKLLFAGCNEVRNGDNWGDPRPDEQAALDSYNKTFIDAVRATGANNTNRTLIVQSYCCSPWSALNYMNVPSDPTPDCLMVEVHCYDPQSFTHHADQDQFWGYRQGYVSENKNQEDYIDDLFSRLRNKFVDAGYPICLGEYGTVSHSVTDPTIMASESYYLEYITRAAKNNGLVPFFWDNGLPNVGNFGFMNRSSGAVALPHFHEGIMKGAAAGRYPF